MKITGQSSNELVLTEGSTQGMIVGGALVVAGALVGYFLYNSAPLSVWVGQW